MKKTLGMMIVLLAVAAAQGQSGAGKGAIFEERVAPYRVGLEAGKLIAQNVVIEGQTLAFVSGAMQGPTVKNAPYSAEAVTETIQRFYDGNQIVRRTTAKQYRDSEGRERREEGMGAIFITDPVAKTRYTLLPDSKTAEMQGHEGLQVFALHTDGKDVVVTTASGKGRGKGVTMVVRPESNDPQVKTESLGTRIIEGVQAEGSRTTRTIPAGAIGNTRPIETIDERWYSPELDLTIMSRHSDPREGETTFQLQNIQRIEQVRSLFEVPADYQFRAGHAALPKLVAPAAPKSR